MLRSRTFAVMTTLAAFALRAYLAFVWLRFGHAKLEGGWLTTNPLEPLLTMVGAGQLPSTMPGYAPVARMLVSLHGDAVLSIAIPFVEIAIALAFVSGVRMRTAALLACALNANLLMAGVASWSLDGRMMVLQVLLICAATLRGSETKYAGLETLNSELRTDGVHHAR